MTTGDPSFEIHPVTVLTDIDLLRPVLEAGIRNPVTREILLDEVDEVLLAIDKSRSGVGDRYYAVAKESGGTVLGIMGLQPPEDKMRAYATSDNPIEVINAYVLRSDRHAGIGRSLLAHLEAKAIERGHSEIILNSGPRYRWSGWPFWRRMYGEPSAVAEKYYDEQFDAPVWRKLLP